MNIDWDAGETHFIEQTSPRVTLREYAAQTDQFAWTGFTRLLYDTVKDYAKTHMWVSKRAEYWASQHTGLAQDAELFYGLLKQKMQDEFDTLKSGELVQLINTLLRLQDQLMAFRPEDEKIDDETITRDEVLDLIDRFGNIDITKQKLLEEAAGILRDA